MLHDSPLAEITLKAVSVSPRTHFQSQTHTHDLSTYGFKNFAPTTNRTPFKLNFSRMKAARDCFGYRKRIFRVFGIGRNAHTINVAGLCFAIRESIFSVLLSTAKRLNEIKFYESAYA